MKIPSSFAVGMVASAILFTSCASPKSSVAKSPQKLCPTVQQEVEVHYAAASPEIQEYILWTAKSFGPGAMWLPENAYTNRPAAERETRVVYLVKLFNEAEYGRHLCTALAEASALKDARLVPGLIKVAGYHNPDKDYDCRPKWIAVSALARQESPDSVPLLISLVDHGNQNTRNWARAALARITGQDFQKDKQAWASWWQAQGHESIPAAMLKPYALPPQTK